MDFDVRCRNGSIVHATEPFPTNVGGSTGPKVVTTTFSLPIGRNRRDRDRVQVAIDLNRAEFQDAFEVRRRAARAAVTLGKKTAAAIRDGVLRYQIERSLITPPLAPAFQLFKLQYRAKEDYEGRDRIAYGEMTARSDDPDAEPDFSVDVPKTFAAAFQALSDGLHSAVFMPENWRAFGKP